MDSELSVTSRVPNKHWKPDTASSQCEKCAKDFGLFRRRHHCRCCGDLFCYNCSSVITATVTLEDIFDIVRDMQEDQCQKEWASLSDSGAATDVAVEVSPSGVDGEMGLMRKASFFTRITGMFSANSNETVRLCVKCQKSLEDFPAKHHEKRKTNVRDANAKISGVVSALNVSPSSENSKKPLYHSPRAVRGCRPLRGMHSERREWSVSLSSRERKVYVISLRRETVREEPSSPVGLGAVFEALERFSRAQLKTTSRSHNAKGVNGSSNSSSMHTRDTSDDEREEYCECDGNTLSTASPSLTSVCSGWVSETSSAEFTLGSCPTAKCSGKRRGEHMMQPRGIPSKNYHSVMLHVPIEAHTHNRTCCGQDESTGVMRVCTQVIGLSHRQSVDKELLRQETIGTDAYIILPNEEPSIFTGVCSTTGKGPVVDTPLSAPSEAQPYGAPSSCGCSQHCALSAFSGTYFAPTHYCSFGPRSDGDSDPSSAHRRSLQAVLQVWQTLEKYGGATPICAVLDSFPCANTSDKPNFADTHYANHHCTYGMEHDPFAVQHAKAKTPDNGLIYVHCHRDRGGAYPSAEAQAEALYRALQMVLTRVVERSALQRDT
ncbi:putative zinc finger protein [Trypanosoma vivax]|uniref:Putative zinc finger protein n=1 Tax=Trypanosoma vivax (strain Y486) TaxID=1055687 RepID=G0TXL1_TRYVY|nr:putative zinc finger protein [Trypanosoma vivax]CCC48701.1 putative zinc finger protein [Trypanosoma vivax Y486]